MGGLGARLLAFFNANIKKRVEHVIEYTPLDFVFTGEGSIDGQTLFGKTPYGVTTIAKRHSVPVIAFAGRNWGKSVI